MEFLDDFALLDQLFTDANDLLPRDKEEEDSESSLVDQLHSVASSCTLISDQQMELGLQPKPKRKRRHIYRGPHDFPLIFKTDYRRRLPQMWINVVNWNDAELFKNFLCQCTHKYCAYVNEIANESKPMLPLIKSKSSRELIVLHCAFKSVCAPDTVCVLNGCMIKRTKNVEGTLILMNITYFASVLYELMLPSAQQTGSVASGLEQEKPKVVSPLDYSPTLSRKQLSKYVVERTDPFRLEITGTLVISMDSSHSVTGFHYRQTNCTTTPLLRPNI